MNPDSSTALAVPGQGGFASFPAEAFFQSNQAEQEAQAQQRQQRLLEAAKAHLSSSSESESESPSASRSTSASARSSDDDEEPSSTAKQQHKRKRSTHGKAGHSSSKKRRKEKSKEASAKHHKHKHKGPAKPSDLDKIMRKEQELAAAAAARRGGLHPGVHTPSTHWADKHATSRAQLGATYFDTKGDVQNLAYLGLYGGNIASYYRRDPLGLARARPGQWDSLRDTDRQPGSSGSRFFHAANVMLERSRRLRRIRLLAGQRQGGAAGPKLSLRRSKPLPSYIPLQENADPPHQQHFYVQQSASGIPIATAAAAAAAAGTQQEEESGETWEEYALRQIRELNAATRERPQDVGMWLRYAAFQDEALQLLGKGVRRASSTNTIAVAEKKVAILTKALDYHPGNTQLLLAMLEVYSNMVDAEGLCRRWEQVIRSTQQRGTPTALLVLWTAYLRLRRTLFMTYQMQSLQTAYSDALPALIVAWTRAQHAGSCTPEELHAMQVGAVRCALDLTELELQGGYNELVVARVQALVEFYCCAPMNSAQAGSDGVGQPYSHGAQLRMFEAFWESTAARAGEEGAKGWAAWFRRENRDLLLGPGAKSAPEDEEEQAERAKEEAESRGGWTGWEELPQAQAATNEKSTEGGQAGGEQQQQQQEKQQKISGLDPEEVLAAAVKEGKQGGGGEGEQEEEENAEEDEEEGGVNEEELMAQLGLRLDRELEELKTQGVQPHVLRVWVAEELQRSRNAWAPLRLPRNVHGHGTAASLATEQPRTSSTADTALEGGGEGEGGEPDLSRVVELDDIRPSLLPVRAPGVRELYLLGLLSLLGVPLGGRWCSSNQPLLLHDDALPPDLLQQLRLRRAARELGGAAGQDHLDSSVLAPVLAPTPWYAEVESRRAFLARLLQLMMAPGAPFHEHPFVSLAYLIVEATSPVKAESQEQQLQQQGNAQNVHMHGDGAQEGQQGVGQAAGATGPSSSHSKAGREGVAGVYAGQQVVLGEVERARNAAKQVLAKQRGNLALWGALAELEVLAGNLKGARRIVETTLSGISSFPAPSRQHHLSPLLVSHVMAEWAHCSGRGGAEEAAARARALHMLAWYLTGSGTDFAPYKPLPQSSLAASPTPEVAQQRQQQLVAAHKGLGRMLPHIAAVSRQGELTHSDAATILAAALLEVAAAHAVPDSGCSLLTALAVFKNTVVTGTNPAVRMRCVQQEWLQTCMCHLVVKETASPEPPLAPAQVRETVLQSLSLYPRNLSLLQLLEALESRGHAYVRLQQFMRAAVDAHPSTHLLAHAMASEVQRQHCSSIVGKSGDGCEGGSVAWGGGKPPTIRLRPLFERAAATRQLSTSPQLWLMYLRYEVQQGAPDAVRRVFLRAVRQCPGSKALWLEGLLYAAATGVQTPAAGAGPPTGLLHPRQAAELLEVMNEKGVRVRTDVMEAVMQALDEQPLLL